MKRTILTTVAILAAFAFSAVCASNAPAAGGTATPKGEPIRLGYLAPLSGTYADLGNSEVEGAKLAVEEVNATGGILGRPVKMFVEDTEAKTDVGTQKIRKLIEKEKVDFTFGEVSSGVSLALAQVAQERGILHIVTGGHSDSITGKDCKWNVFRIPTTTMMEAKAIGKFLAEKFGKKWYIMTPDYAYGWSLQEGFEKVSKELGGKIVGADRLPLGTTDYSAALVKVGQTKPDVLLVLQAGQDAVNALKQITQFGLNKQMAVAGGLMEWEVINALPLEARIGWWTFEWYFNQPDVPAAKAFSDKIQKHYNHAATARNWFGYVAIQTVARIANKEKALDGQKLAKALEGWTLPPDLAMEPNKVYYRAGDHQLMGSVYVGEVRSDIKKSDPDLFKVSRVVPGDEAALPVDQTGCTIKYPGK